eukprot:768500-Hanusia_phi.AAC.9
MPSSQRVDQTCARLFPGRSAHDRKEVRRHEEKGVTNPPPSPHPSALSSCRALIFVVLVACTQQGHVGSAAREVVDEGAEEETATIMLGQVRRFLYSQVVHLRQPPHDLLLLLLRLLPSSHASIDNLLLSEGNGRRDRGAR